MRMRPLIAALVIGSVATVVVLRTRPAPAVTADAPAPASVSRPIPIASPASTIAPAVALMDTAASGAGEPGILEGFGHWTEQQRQVAIAGILGNPALDLDVVAFLSVQLGNRQLDEITRNDIANVLVLQEPHDPALGARLMAMAADQRESATWRDYALQHAARAVSFSDQPQAIVATLGELARHGAGTQRGTALLQLDRLDRDGVVPGLATTIDEDIAALAQDREADLANRLSAIGLIGSREVRGSAPMVRDLLDTAVEPSLIRICLATLGSIGNPSDRPLIEAYLHHEHPLVALAARSALERLTAQKPGPS